MNTSNELVNGSTSTKVGSNTEERALKMLGQGLNANVVAAATGVTEARISQLLSDPNFAAEVAALRFSAFNKHTERDGKYDALEDTLLERMQNLLPMMYKPQEVLKAIQVINAAKRRGAQVSSGTEENKQIVSLIMPSVVVNKFAVNVHNQVINTGTQELTTIGTSEIPVLASRSSLKAKIEKLTMNTDSNSHEEYT